MKVFKLAFLGLILVSLISCDNKEEEPSVTIDDFVGSWDAGSFVFTNNANSSEVVDLIALGGELRFTMLDGGRVRTWFTLDTISDEWDSQAVLTDNNTLTLTPAETQRGLSSLEFVLDDNTLELTNHSDSFDFTLSGGSEVPATSVSFFERN